MFRSKSADRMGAAAALFCALSLLAACAGGPDGPTPIVSAPASIAPDALVGRWGLAAYHRESDRPRTEAEAKRQCNNPYNITRGPNGGVIMHLADVAEPQELVLKGGPGGANFLGLSGAAGAPEDREVFAVSEKSFSVKWVNPDNANRYGMMIYVRCA